MDTIITNRIDVIVKTAKQELISRNKFLALLLHAYQDAAGEIDFFIVPADSFLENNYTKKMMLAGSHALAKANMEIHGKQLLCACLVADAFLSVQKMKQEHIGLKKIPSNSGYMNASSDPERMEGLMVITATKANAADLIYHIYERREGEGVVFTGALHEGTAQGALVNLFPDNISNQKNKN